MQDDIKLPEPALYVGMKLLPYEQRMFATAGLRESLGYTSSPVDYYTADQVRAAVLADREARQWMPVEIDGVRGIPYPLTTRIDVKTADGTVFYGTIVGDVCVALEKPKRKKPGIFSCSLAPWTERWFGVVTHYRLADAQRAKEDDDA